MRHHDVLSLCKTRSLGAAFLFVSLHMNFVSPCLNEPRHLGVASRRAERLPGWDSERRWQGKSPHEYRAAGFAKRLHVVAEHVADERDLLACCADSFSSVFPGLAQGAATSFSPISFGKMPRHETCVCTRICEGAADVAVQVFLRLRGGGPK